MQRPSGPSLWSWGRVACLLALGGCEQIIVLGSECPDTRGVCDERPSESAPDAALPTVDEDAESPPDGEDAQTEPCTDPCVCDAGSAARIAAHWRLDERTGQSVADSTGHVANGVLQNVADAGPWVEGKVAGALQLDGVDDQAQLGSVAGEVRTLSLWLKPGNTQVISGLTPAQLPTSHGPLDQWADPQLAYRSDRSWSTVASLIGTRAQHWGGFHLSQHLPRDAQILGITVTVETGNLGLLGGLDVELSWDGGASHTDTVYVWGQLIAGSNLRQAGGPDRLWARTWKVDDFSDENFRVRATFGGIANTMALDFLSVEVRYAEHTTGRDVLALSSTTALTFANDDDTLSTRGWPDSQVYVNGVASGALTDAWNHVHVVGSPVRATSVTLGRAVSGYLGFPYQGSVDDVRLIEQALTLEQLDALDTPPMCAR